MRLTVARQVIVLDGENTFYFYNGDEFCNAYHERDIPVEWQQLAFILENACKLEDFEYAEWEGGTVVELAGLSQAEVINLDCKLINQQFGSKIPVERQLQVGVKDASVSV